MKRIAKIIVTGFIICLLLGTCVYAATPYQEWLSTRSAENAIKTSVALNGSNDIDNTAWTMDDGRVNRLKPDEKAGDDPGIDFEYYKYYVDDNVMHSKLREEDGTLITPLKTGMHYESMGVSKGEELNIYKFSAAYINHTCIHGIESGSIESYGKTFNFKKCNAYQSDGWIAYCAECGKRIPLYLYAGQSSIEKLNGTLVQGSAFYSECSKCGGLETLAEINHQCDVIPTWNKYTVHYAKSDDKVMGSAADTVHTYNNKKQDNGGIANPDEQLRGHSSVDASNTFSWNGREKTLVGWKTEDGNLIFRLGDTWYNEGASSCVQNKLIEGGYLPINDNGDITFYTVFEDSLSSLKINPNGGKFEGKTEVTTKENLVYRQIVDLTDLKAPIGYAISFMDGDTNILNDQITTKSFNYWEKDAEYNFITGKKVFNGYISPDNSCYAVNNYLGDVDILKAIWKNNSFTLPYASKEGYSFAGWYSDKELTQFVGNAGDTLTFNSDTVLYASFVSLTLYSEDNYNVFSGSGATDLRWTFKNNHYNHYKLYQSADLSNWTLIDYEFESGQSNNFSSSDTVLNYLENVQTYSVTENGVYEISATGAQGENYGDYTGGKGGKTGGKVYLYNGESLSVYTGGQNGYSLSGYEGGAKTDFNESNPGYSNGGGATVIILNSPDASRNGKVLMIAAGGGGATAIENGGNGNNVDNTTLTENSTGEAGMAGGGGGYKGGISGVGEHLCKGTLKKVTTTSQDTIFYKGPPNEHYGTVKCKAILSDGSQCGYVGYWGITTEYRPSGNIYWSGTCPKCGNSGNGGDGPRTYTTTTYDCQICGTKHKTDIGVCNASIDNAPLSPSYGGSNYIDETICFDIYSDSSDDSGNGSCKITKYNFGNGDYLSYSGLRSTDYAVPNAIDASKTEIEPYGDSLKVTWQPAIDNGTKYYHKVIAETAYYEEGNSKVETTESNITLNTLTSGTKRYYFTYNTTENSNITGAIGARPYDGTEVALSTLPYAGGLLSGSPLYYTEDFSVILENAGRTGFLHVAAIDVAALTSYGNGNLGPTAHIRIDEDIPEINWDLYVDTISITVEGQNVYRDPDTAKTYFVKADSQSPFNLSFDGFLGYYDEGRYYPINTPVSENYQINDMQFTVLDMENSELQDSVLHAPNYTGEIPSMPIVLTAPTITKSMTMPEVLKDGFFVQVTRADELRQVTALQKFFANADYAGQKFYVYPSISATNMQTGVTTNSLDSNDRTKGIYLIYDGNAPVIEGINDLEDASENTIYGYDEFILTAKDEGEAESGVKTFYVVISKPEADVNFRIPADSNNTITIDLTDPALAALFEDEFKLTVYAEDNVGNVTEKTYNLLTFDMQTKLERILPPHDPDFQEGEAGLLTIDIVGNPDTVTITMPKELLDMDNDRCKNQSYNVPATENTSFEYRNLTDDTVTIITHRHDKKLTYQYKFWIPLYSPNGSYKEGGNYSPIIIKAYKNGNLMGTNYEGFTVNGTILDEFRTSIVE